MIYSVVSQSFNGTSCVSTKTYAIEASNFEKAKDIFLNWIKKSKNSCDTDFEYFDYNDCFKASNDVKVSDSYSSSISYSDSSGNFLNFGEYNHGPIFLRATHSLSKAALHIIK